MRTIGLAVLLSLLVSALPMAALAAEAEPQTAGGLANAGFEQTAAGKPVGWTGLSQTSVFESVYQPVHSGSYSVKLTDTSTSAGNGLRSSRVTVQPGSLYKAGVQVYQETGNAQLYLEFWNAADQRIGVQIGAGSSSGKWTPIEVTGEAPEGTAYATLLLYQHQANVGVAYFDDASLIELPAGLPYNGGFEEVTQGKPAGWTPLGAGIDYASSVTTVLDGVYSVKMKDPSASAGPGLRSGSMPVVPDNLYRAAVHSYNESGTSQLYLEFWNSANVRIDTKIATNSDIGTWSPITIEAYAPAGAVYATLLLYQHKTNVGTAYFDRAEFGLVPSEPVREFPLQTPSHPRLYFTPDDLPSLKARAADETSAPFGTTGKQLWQGIRGNADAYMRETSFSLTYYGGKVVTFPLPPVQPGPIPNPPGYDTAYPYWTMMTRGVQDRLEVLSLAHIITGESSYGQKAKDYLLSVAGWNSWTDPNYPCGGNTCLDTAHLTFGVSMAFDLLYDSLTEQERKLVLTALEEKGVKPLYKDARNKMDHNIQTLRAAALGSGAAVLLGHSPGANAYLTRAMEFYEWYLDTRMTSGQQEGMLYTSYAMDNMIKAFDHINRVTGERSLATHPFLNDFLVRWVTYNLAPGGGGLAKFSDSSEANYFGLTMNVINAWLNNGMAGWYLKETKSAVSGIDGFLYFRPDAATASPDEWPGSAVFDEIGWASLRSGWSEDDVLFAMIANNSRLGHNHYDQNSFQIATNRTWIANDPGYQDYVAGPMNDFTERLGHSTIQVDGKSQSVKGGGSLQKGMLSPTYDTVVGSAAGAYGNPKLTQFDRHAVRLGNDTFVLLDELKSDAPHVYDWILYSGQLDAFEIDGAAAQAGVTVPGSKLYVRRGGAQLAAAFLGEEELPITVSTYPGAESLGFYTRVGSGESAKEGRFLTVLKAGAYKPVGQYDEASLLPLTASSGKEFKLIQAAGSTVMFYRGSEPGDYMTVTVNVPESGTYNLQSRFLHSPLYGQVQVYVDGQSVGDVYDGYAPEVLAAESFEHGDVQLTAGAHTIRYEVVGKHAQSGNFFIGLDALQLLPAGAAGPDPVKLNVDADYVLGTGGVAARIRHQNAASTADLVVFRTGEGTVAAGGSVTDAEQAVVTAAADGAVTGMKMTRGSSLQWNGRILLAGEHAYSAALDTDSTRGVTEGVLESETAQTIRVHAPEGAFVLLDGQLLQEAGLVRDEEAGTIALRLEAGRHSLRLLSLPEQIAAYEASGSVQGPLAQPLRNDARQALHHWSKGAAEQARHHLQMLLDRLSKPELNKFATDQARSGLERTARELMNRFN